MAGEPAAGSAAALIPFVDTYDTSMAASGTDKVMRLDEFTKMLVPPGVAFPYEGRVAPPGYLMEFGQAVSRATYAALFAVKCPVIGTCTVTLAAPGVFTLAAHGFVEGDQIYLTTTGALPTGLVINTLYYVKSPTTNTFSLSATRTSAGAGTAITTSGSQSGVHSASWCPDGNGDGTTTFNMRDRRGKVSVGVDAMGIGGARANVLPDIITALGFILGEEYHTLLAAELAAHAHGLTDPSHSHSVSELHLSQGWQTAFNTYNIGAWSSQFSGSNIVSDAGSTGLIVVSAGSSTPHNNVQPSTQDNWIVKT
jgi:microcystin-dependent protein